MIKIGDMFDIEKGSVQSSKCVKGHYNFITASEEWKTHNEYSHNCEALIFAMGASGSLGRTHYVKGKFISSDLCFIMTPKKEYKNKLNLRFYYYYFNTFREKIVLATATGTSKLAINRKIFSNYKIHYIDIDKQTALIPIIEKMQELSKKLFNDVNEQEKYISSLRQSILQQTVEGKLCEQSPNDESASALLEKIKLEKEKLIGEKKTKRQKDLPPITDEEKPFDLPQGWEWCRLGTLLKDLKYGTSVPCTYDSKNSVVLRIPNINTETNKVDLSDIKYADLSSNEIAELSLKENDILLIRSNGSASLVGRIAVVEKVPKNICYAGYLMRLRTYGIAVDNFYLKRVFNCRFLRNSIELPIRTTTGVKNINSTEVSNLLVPLPPLTEQQRIVEKVDKLMALCDELEKEVVNAKKHASQLMEAVLQEAFSSAKEEHHCNVIEFAPKLQQEQMPFIIAARGKIKESTWNSLMARAQELAGEES